MKITIGKEGTDRVCRLTPTTDSEEVSIAGLSKPNEVMQAYVRGEVSNKIPHLEIRKPIL